MLHKKKSIPETCGGPSVCECTKRAWWKAWVKTRWHWMTYPLCPNLVSDAPVQRLKDSVSHSAKDLKDSVNDIATVQKLKKSVKDIATFPHLVICPCKCHRNMALTVHVEESASPTTKEHKTAIGN
jgi:hypothetical protein